MQPRKNKANLARLWEETQKLGELCKTHAQIAKSSQKKELRRLKEGIAYRQMQLKRVAIKAESCEGSYAAALAAFRAVAQAQLLTIQHR